MQIKITLYCPDCQSTKIKKNGNKSYGKQNYFCKSCSRQFIGDHALSYKGWHSELIHSILAIEAIKGNLDSHNPKITHCQIFIAAYFVQHHPFFGEYQLRKLKQELIYLLAPICVTCVIRVQNIPPFTKEIPSFFTN